MTSTTAFKNLIYFETGRFTVVESFLESTSVTIKHIIFYCLQKKKFENITIESRQLIKHVILVNFIKDQTVAQRKVLKYLEESTMILRFSFIHLWHPQKMTNFMTNFFSYQQKWIIDLLLKNNQTHDKLQMYGPFTGNCRSSHGMCSIKKRCS